MNFDLKKPRKEVISIRIDIDILDRVEKLAGQYDMSRNEVVVQCIEYALNNMNDKSDS